MSLDHDLQNLPRLSDEDREAIEDQYSVIPALISDPEQHADETNFYEPAACHAAGIWPLADSESRAVQTFLSVTRPAGGLDYSHDERFLKAERIIKQWCALSIYIEGDDPGMPHDFSSRDIVSVCASLTYWLSNIEPIDGKSFDRDPAHFGQQLVLMMVERWLVAIDDDTAVGKLDALKNALREVIHG